MRMVASGGSTRLRITTPAPLRLSPSAPRWLRLGSSSPEHPRAPPGMTPTLRSLRRYGEEYRDPADEALIRKLGYAKT